ncbi:MAG: hypothetical protein R3330_04215 [Saprospiraceae bacterium]|nr:hypothetical protein [Saprospiraceae bacterium]
MKITVGNDHALFAYKDPDSENPEEWKYRPLPGERETEIVLPDNEAPLMDQFRDTIGVLRHHMEEDAVPAWVVAEDEEAQPLVDLLRSHYKIKRKTKPKTWGKKG